MVSLIKIALPESATVVQALSGEDTGVSSGFPIRT